MIINNEQLVEISKMQALLDADIMQQKNLQWEDTMLHRVIAAIVELGEFANEERFFKFWSNKPASEKAVCLDEYVDILHFIMSVSNFVGADMALYEFEDLDIETEENEKREAAFAYTAMCLSGLFQGVSVTSIFLVFDAYFNLGDVFGFEWDEVYAAYQAKNKVNFERLASGY